MWFGFWTFWKLEFLLFFFIIFLLFFYFWIMEANIFLKRRGDLIINNQYNTFKMIILVFILLYCRWNYLFVQIVRFLAKLIPNYPAMAQTVLQGLSNVSVFILLVTTVVFQVLIIIHLIFIVYCVWKCGNASQQCCSNCTMKNVCIYFW